MTPLQLLVDEWAAALAELEQRPTAERFDRYRNAMRALRAAATPREA